MIKNRIFLNQETAEGENKVTLRLARPWIPIKNRWPLDCSTKSYTDEYTLKGKNVSSSTTYLPDPN